MKPQKMTVAEFAQKLGHTMLSQTIPITGFCVDSRNAKEGEVFFALPGAKVDGHAYLADLAAKGVIAAVVSTTYSGPDFGLILLPVEDVLASLQTLAKNKIKQSSARIVAVTGSVGKTTTKGFIVSLLSRKFRVGTTTGNSNSQIGLPLGILNHIQGDEEILVLEMGMTHHGNIKKLIEIAPPEVALLNSTVLAHAMNFSGLDDIGRAKAEIFLHPSTKLGILHRDIPNFEELSRIGHCPKISFSLTANQADYFLKTAQDQLEITAPEGKAFLQQLPLPGQHNTHNLLSAIVVARYFGMSWKEIDEGIPQLTLPERRFQRIEKKGALFINDSYNANVVSVKSALQSLPQPAERGKKIAVLGDMPELGKFSEQCHREVGECALQCVDEMICLGQETKTIEKIWNQAGRKVLWFATLSELIPVLQKKISPGDVILIKGANSKQMWKILEEI